MYLPGILAFIAMVFFGVAAVYYSLEADKYKNSLKEFINKDSSELFHSLLSGVTQSEFAYAFELGKIMPALTEYILANFPLTTVSVLYVKMGKPVFITHIKEQVGNNFIREIKDSALQAYLELGATLPPDIETQIQGMSPNDSLVLPATYFHIPFFINEKISVILTIASSKPKFYSEKNILSFYELADIISLSYTSVSQKVAAEKDKVLDLLGSLTDGFVVFGANLEVLTINSAAKQYLQVTDGVNLSEDILSTFPPAQNIEEKIKDSMKNNKKMELDDIIIKERIFNIFIKPVHDNTQESVIVGATLLIHEVTVEKSIAQMKEDFTNIIVHELRSPLTSIKASTQLLTSGAQLTPDEQTKLISLISSQANKLLDEVARILDAAKLEAGLFTIQKMPGDIKKIISEKVTLFSAQAQERFIKLTSDIDPNLPTFSFDIIHIGQVVNNLLSNSLKFTSTGGTIHISAKQEAGKVIVAVSDTGCGVPKDKQHLLFSKFSQVSTPGAHVGTGLGLYITKGIIQAHGGTIMLNSEENKGTTITFTLPVDINTPKTPGAEAGKDELAKPLTN